MEEVKPTRSELIARRQQMTLATEGMKLLKEKRDALMMELMKVMDDALIASDELETCAKNANFSLSMARAVDGPVNVRSVSYATTGIVQVGVSTVNVMGVTVPEIESKDMTRSLLTRGYGIPRVSSRIDRTAEKFEQELEAIIKVAAVEVRLKKIGDEIQKTRRRVNALEHVVIPELQQQVTYIRMVLDERGREDLFRLKKVKASLEKKKEKEKREKAALETGVIYG